MKNLGKLVLGCVLACAVFSACTKESESSVLKVGMVTDAGTIDDKSFNQGTWEGIQKAKADFNIDIKYLKPEGTAEADYVKEISNLYDSGYKFIICPGYKFESAIFKAQTKYKDAKFVIIDGNAKPANAELPENGPDTVGINFLENEASFLAGVAAALQVKEGNFGFIGGLEIPAVQKFNWGWQQGIKYANENLGTNIKMNAENFIYSGSFNDIAAGQQIAASMYDRGVSVIHAAAGGVGIGVINEAKTRTQAGDKVWVVGVDVDQYPDGIIADGSSVILTSAVKGINVAAYDMIKAELNKEFKGGRSLLLTVKENAVGIPEQNPNLSEEVQKKVEEVHEKLKNGEILVSSIQGELYK